MMKKLKFVLGLIFLFLVAARAPAPPPLPTQTVTSTQPVLPTPTVSPSAPTILNARLNENFVLRVGQTGILTDSPDKFGITFWNMKQDSRCPQGVACVWAGEVRVEITFQENGVQHPPILELTTTPNDPKHKIAIANYLVELVNVEPPNVAGKLIARDEYAATFRMTRASLTPTPASNITRAQRKRLS